MYWRPMFYRLSAQRIEIAQTVQGLLELKSDSVGIVGRLETLFTTARAAKVDVFAGDETYHKRWRSLLKGLDKEDRERLLTNYIGADKLNEYDPSCLSPANVTEFVECIDGDEDGQPLGWISDFLQKYLEWTPITLPRLSGAELREALEQLGKVHEICQPKTNLKFLALVLSEVKIRNLWAASLGKVQMKSKEFEVIVRKPGVHSYNISRDSFNCYGSIDANLTLLELVMNLRPDLKHTVGFFAERHGAWVSRALEIAETSTWPNDGRLRHVPIPNICVSKSTATDIALCSQMEKTDFQFINSGYQGLMPTNFYDLYEVVLGAVA